MTPPPTTATFISVRRDARDRLPGNDEVADVQQQSLYGAGDGGRDLGVDLVGVRFHQRLSLGDVFALLLAPRADRDLFRALQVGHDDVLGIDAHVPIVLTPLRRRRAARNPSNPGAPLA